MATKVFVYDELIGTVNTNRSHTNGELIELAGGHWLEEHGCWTLRPDDPDDEAFWYTGEDIVLVDEEN